ncbi:2-aminoethanethiol (cysteamine) dioxygenase a [Trichomycterus rosablanca]|uniref:2-aminoethanethiol (cysteamine) dioxygenase a n=1 Tax=Trichomycterus rosablanca TaxID=2290929 RepID=UPI002F35E3AD
MPRNSRPSLIQKIAKQADITFKNCCSPGIGHSKEFAANLTELGALLNRIRAADLNVIARKDASGSAESSGPQAHLSAPVSYTHICETRTFSMGVFTLRSGASIPLHDHPDMNGMLKVLYGKVRIRCFDKSEPGPDSQAPVPEEKESVRLAVLRACGEFTEHSAPCVLSPHRDNLHQIDALDGPAAFLDILAPPYDPDHGRDCHYYRVLRTDTQNGDDTKKETVWLLEIPQPEEFWCGGEPYRGPRVTV